jgi:DNA-binding NarL/FixJ family response regulator
MTVCADVGTAEHAITAVLQDRPDACLLEVTLPGGGIAAAEEIALRAPGVAVIMLTVVTDDASLFAALRAGARGYLVKDTDPERLPYAIRGVLAGEAAVPRGMLGRVLDEFCARDVRRRAISDDALSEREWEVMELLASGLPTRAVAASLAISEVTVRRHASVATQKLHAPDRQAALRKLTASSAGRGSRLQREVVVAREAPAPRV